MRTRIFCLVPASQCVHSPTEATRACTLLTAREARLPTNLRARRKLDFLRMTSMTSTTTNSLRHFSLKLTSSLLKLVNGSTHGDESWYACVLHHFHDNYIHVSMTTTDSSRHFSSNLLTATHMEMKLGTHVYYHDDNRHFSLLLIFIRTT